MRVFVRRWPRTRAAAALAMILLGQGVASAATVKLAVASNFRASSEQLAAAFERQTGNTVRLTFGSTGVLYAQIRHGAPFDAFFAADIERPRRLEQEGAIVPGTRFTYAQGALALWSAQPDYELANGKVLRTGDFDHIALANPELAPYGRAAKQTLQAFKRWKTLRQAGRLVMGQNIGQTHQMIASGSVALGFVALSQIKQPRHEVAGRYWPVPAKLYAPIEQQAVLLRDAPAASAFLIFVRGPVGREIIESYGYQIPTGSIARRSSAAAESGQDVHREFGSSNLREPE